MTTVRAGASVLRFALGMAQMFGAVTAATLLLWTGLNVVTLLAVLLTTVVAVVSRVILRRR